METSESHSRRRLQPVRAAAVLARRQPVAQQAPTLGKAPARMALS
jgi:hypothetical protein